MLAIARGDSVHLGSVRCRGGRDALRDRLALETAMADVSGSSVGLPPQALLFVRRIAPPVPLRAKAAASRFAAAVRTELTQTLRTARRPWLAADAASADAVLFADEAELAACLVRDWLQGRVVDRWWWKQLLGSHSVTEWLRSQLIDRGETFAAVTEILRASGQVVEWYARLEPAQVSRARIALSAAYGIVADEASLAPAAEFERGRGEVAASKLAGPRVGSETAALRDILEIAPEVASPVLDVERRCLLAAALVVRRRLHWAKSPEFVVALHALREPAPLIGKSDLRTSSSSQEKPALSAVLPDRVETSDAAPDRAPELRHEPRRESTPAFHSNDVSQDVVTSSAQQPGMRALEDIGESSRAKPGASSEPSPPPAPVLPRQLSAEVGNSVTPMRSVAPLDAAPPATLHNASAPLHQFEQAPLPQSVHTAFGGIFYLLNVALALGLYGDFTMPRYKGIDLSPWDWLAAIGRRWFGKEFRKDPIWKLLAELAGHLPRARPERGFKPPQGESVEPWFAEQLTYLKARIARAIGADDAAQVPDRVCRHRAHIYMSASAVDVHLSLDDLPIELRAGGLDRDPGWIPAAGRSVRFHFT